MGDFKWFVFVLFFGVTVGCSIKGAPDVYEQGYRQGVREHVEDIVQRFEGGDFPYFNWVAPIVQDVRIPAHVANGVFIPEHNELVIIKPGEWKKEPAFPINSSKESYESSSTLQFMDGDVADITQLPDEFRTLTSTAVTK